MRILLIIALAGTIASTSQATPAQTPSADSLPHNCASVTTPFVGTLCMPPDDSGKHPAMILLGGSEGGDSFSRLAPLFAAHGYVTASLAYFGAPALPPVLVNVPVETVGSAVNALDARPDVNGKIGILGISRGGELSLLAASTYSQIKAVVAIVPSPIAYMGLGASNIPTGCAWTKNGSALPCVHPDAAARAQITAEFRNHQPLVLAPFYDASRKSNPSEATASFFPLEKIAGPVMCLAGGDDEMWNSSSHCDLTMQYLKNRKHPFPDSEVAYPNAGHLFIAAVGGPQSALNSVTVGGVTMAFGGTPQGDASAASAAWQKIWQFLTGALGG